MNTEFDIEDVFDLARELSGMFWVWDREESWVIDQVPCDGDDMASGVDGVWMHWVSPTLHIRGVWRW